MLGILLLPVGVWVGFIGWTETNDRGLYEEEVTTTYPIAGVFAIMGGLGTIVRGAQTMMGKTDEDLGDSTVLAGGGRGDRR